MEIAYLCEFVTLAETCSYMEAADQLFISQSALSRHIKALEEELDVQLFDRSTRRVSLSSYGHLLLPYAKQLVALRSGYETALANARSARHGNIRIGTIPAMVQYGITDFIVRFRQENPSYTVDIVENDPTDLAKMLRSGQCDLAFLRDGPENIGEFNSIHYTTDTLCAFLRKDHPFAKREFLRIEHLQNQPLILLSKGSLMYNMCVAACRDAGFEPTVVVTGRRSSNILDFVRRGTGIALLTKRPIMHLLTDDLTFLDIEPRIITSINLVYPKNRPLDPGAQWFIDSLNARL